jgi:hypothetical protein
MIFPIFPRTANQLDSSTTSKFIFSDNTQRFAESPSMSVCDTSTADSINDLCTLQARKLDTKFQYQRTPGQILSLTRNFDFSLNYSPTEHIRKTLEQHESLTAKGLYNFDKLNASTSMLQQPCPQQQSLNHSRTALAPPQDPSVFKTWSFKLKNDANKKKLVKRNSSANLMRQRLFGCSDDTPLKWSKYKSFDSSVSKNLKRLFTDSSATNCKKTGLTADFDLFKMDSKTFKVLLSNLKVPIQ